MIIPCIDLMDGKVVQLKQGREKVLEGRSPDEMLQLFAGFPQIQAIDLDAAMGRGSNTAILQHLAHRATVRAGGGVRSVARAEELIAQGAFRIIVGTAAFTDSGPNFTFLRDLRSAIGAEALTLALDSKGGRIVTKGWQETTALTAAELLGELEPYCSGFLCTYVDKEGMMEGTDHEWFASLRERTSRELVAAGGITTVDDIKRLSALNIHCAVGMSIYTGHLALDALADLNRSLVHS